MANLQVTDAASVVLPALAAQTQEAADGDRKRSHPSDLDDVPDAKRPRTASGATACLPSIRMPACKHEIPPSALDFLRSDAGLTSDARLAVLEALIRFPYFGVGVPQEPFEHNVGQIGAIVGQMAGVDPVAALMHLFLFLADKVFCTKEQLAIAKRAWLAGSARVPEIPAAVRALVIQAIEALPDQRTHILGQLCRLVPHLSYKERIFAVSFAGLNIDGFSDRELALLRGLCKNFVTEAMADDLPTVQMGSRIVVVPENMSSATAILLTAQLAGKLVRPTREYASLSMNEEIAVDTIATAVFLLGRA